ncbi:MAG: response regulator [Bdellovibrionales bacterium]|nr:response regulator [Bdellovibrionales bacterium]
MAKEQILVVEDEEEIVELIDYNLGREGFKIERATTGEDGLAIARSLKPDLILLDIMLPGIHGLDVCRSLKSDPNTSDIPVIIISARGEETDVVTGLELGADDYMTKPFSPRVLVARTRAVLRRKKEAAIDETSALNVHELRINPGKHEVFLKENALSLTATEFRILHFLARHPGWVFTRQQIVDTVHGEDYPVTERSIDVQIAGLRKKLGESSDYIETVRGIGYRMKE